MRNRKPLFCASLVIVIASVIGAYNPGAAGDRIARAGATTTHEAAESMPDSKLTYRDAIRTRYVVANTPRSRVPAGFFQPLSEQR